MITQKPQAGYKKMSDWLNETLVAAVTGGGKALHREALQSGPAAVFAVEIPNEV